MTISASNRQALESLVLSAERLRSLSLPAEALSPLLDLAMLATLRTQLGENRPTWAGFIGCTGSGKSTLFNSLCGHDVCITGWKAHNTTGPVMLSSEHFGQTLQKLEQDFAPLFLPQWKRESLSLNNTVSEAGLPGALRWIQTPEAAWDRTILFDLPDINTTRAIYENHLALALLPWLDTIIFVVDEETLYHRDYEEPVNQAKALMQRRICVLNHRGRDRVELDHPDVQGVRDFFGVDTIHVLPDLGSKPLFDREPAFLRFRDDLLLSGNHASNRPLVKRIAPIAKNLAAENERRRRVLHELETRAERVVRERLSVEKPISIHRVLNDEALQILEHMGLKRFSISNLFLFFKRVTTTGALRRSFQISFGNQREDTVSQLLRLDIEKLKDEISARVSDHWEAVRHALFSHPDAHLLGKSLAPVPDSNGSNCPYAQALRDAVDAFEEECRSLIASDKLSTSLKTDPLLVVGLLVALIADVLTIPGFGSWVLVPSVFKYIPVGKFEKTKRAFQQRIRDIIRETLMEDIHQIQAARRSITLDSSDPLLKALRTLAGNDED